MTSIHLQPGQRFCRWPQHCRICTKVFAWLTRSLTLELRGSRFRRRCGRRRRKPYPRGTLLFRSGRTKGGDSREWVVILRCPPICAQLCASGQDIHYSTRLPLLLTALDKKTGSLGPEVRNRRFGTLIRPTDDRSDPDAARPCEVFSASCLFVTIASRLR